MHAFIDDINKKYRPLSRRRPTAVALIRGDAGHENLRGKVAFYETAQGVVVVSEIVGLPQSEEKCNERFFAMHIHGGGSCTGNMSDPFADAGTHFNPEGCPHPQHAGDLPPLLSNDGHAWSAVLTGRFRVKDIIGKTVIIHSSTDDFKSQPAGNSGRKIACGRIE